MTTVTRFAPSPTGRLHLGHAYSAMFAAERGDNFLLRIEDIDLGRCRPEFEEGIYEDLAWLGLEWERPVRRQSEHLADHAAALAKLDASGLLYPCFCTRKEIKAASSAPHGPEGTVYPGTCRKLSEDERGARVAAGQAYALRFIETDTVLGRKDMPTSYHIAVVVDDAVQGVTLVTRGEDLAFARPLHEHLQGLLGLPTPIYEHHRILTGADGRRFAKRDKSLTLAALREAGETPADIRRHVLDILKTLGP